MTTLGTKFEKMLLAEEITRLGALHQKSMLNQKSSV